MTGRYVGARVMRVEDPRFLAGRGVYLDDIEPPGTLHVAFCRSPYAHARIVSVDCSRARALDGVALVVSGEDLRDLPPFSTTIATRPGGQDRHPAHAPARPRALRRRGRRRRRRDARARSPRTRPS